MNHESIGDLVTRHSDLCSQIESLQDEADGMVVEARGKTHGKDVLYEDEIHRISGATESSGHILFNIKRGSADTYADWSELGDVQEKGRLIDAEREDGFETLPDGGCK